MPKCKKCRLDHSKKTEYGKMMDEFNKRKLKGVITEQKQVYLSGRA